MTDPRWCNSKERAHFLAIVLPIAGFLFVYLWCTGLFGWPAPFAFIAGVGLAAYVYFDMKKTVDPSMRW